MRIIVTDADIEENMHITYNSSTGLYTMVLGEISIPDVSEDTLGRMFREFEECSKLKNERV